MSVSLKMINQDQEEVLEQFLLRVPGWSEERFLDEAPEMWFCELEDGELIMHSPVNIRHQDIVGFLSGLLRYFNSKFDLGVVLCGPAVIRLRLGLLYEPDIFFIRKDRTNNLMEQYYSGAPDFVVEVISPSGRSHDLKTKANQYHDHGVQEYWTVDTEKRSIHQHVLPTNLTEPYTVSFHTEGKIFSTALSGFWIDAGWLWQDLLPSEAQCLEQILGV